MRDDEDQTGVRCSVADFAVKHGTLQAENSKPDIGLESGDSPVQTGVAAALAAAVAPLAAVLAFVDPGLAEDANCAALLAEAKREARR